MSQLDTSLQTVDFRQRAEALVISKFGTAENQERLRSLVNNNDVLERDSFQSLMVAEGLATMDEMDAFYASLEEFRLATYPRLPSLVLADAPEFWSGTVERAWEELPKANGTAPAEEPPPSPETVRVIRTSKVTTERAPETAGTDSVRVTRTEEVRTEPSEPATEKPSWGQRVRDIFRREEPDPALLSIHRALDRAEKDRGLKGLNRDNESSPWVAIAAAIAVLALIVALVWLFVPLTWFAGLWAALSHPLFITAGLAIIVAVLVIAVAGSVLPGVLTAAVIVLAGLVMFWPFGNLLPKRSSSDAAVVTKPTPPPAVVVPGPTPAPVVVPQPQTQVVTVPEDVSGLAAKVGDLDNRLKALEAKPTVAASKPAAARKVSPRRSPTRASAARTAKPSIAYVEGTFSGKKVPYRRQAATVYLPKK